MISGYQGQVATSYGAAIELQGAGTDLWHSIYAPTALTNTVPGILAYNVSSGVVQPIWLSAAQNTVMRNQVIVVDNSPLGLGTIPAGTWGFAKIRGYCLADVLGAAGLAAEGDALELNGDQDYFVDQTSNEGEIIDTTTSAIILEAYTTTEVADKSVYLLGTPCTIAAS